MTRHCTLAFVLTALLIGWACDDAPTFPTQPTEPPPPLTSETFSGDLTRNGAKTFPFPTLAGSVTATLTSLGPDSTLAIGLSLGAWNGSVCQIILANDNAVQGTVIVGKAATLGNLCVRVYDVGTLTDTIAFVVTVEHP